MRKIGLIIIILTSLTKVGLAQLRGINYQAVAVDENGQALEGIDINGAATNITINVRFTIMGGNAAGPVLYQETQTANTDQ